MPNGARSFTVGSKAVSYRRRLPATVLRLSRTHRSNERVFDWFPIFQTISIAFHGTASKDERVVLIVSLPGCLGGKFRGLVQRLSCSGGLVRVYQVFLVTKGQHGGLKLVRIIRVIKK